MHRIFIIPGILISTFLFFGLSQVQATETTQEQPPVATCPYVASDTVTVITFDDERLFSDRGLSQAQTDIYDTNLAAGQYNISLVSWDGFVGREQQNQPQEQYFVELFAGQSVVGVSGSIGDLADLVRAATQNEMVNKGFVLETAITGVKAVQTAYPDHSSANSVQPICVAFERTGDITPDPILGCTDETATNFSAEADTDDGSCEFPVETVFTCADNVSFTASDVVISSGEEITLSWSTIDADTVSITDVETTDLSGSATVSPDEDITYTLTATQASSSIACPLTIGVNTSSSGGGGGASVRCELAVSDDEIIAGQAVTLSWETSGARDVNISDNRGGLIMSTAELLSEDKVDLLDGSVVLNPTQDTTYILVAERGSRDRECSISVDIVQPGTSTNTSSSNNNDEIIVLETRDQLPLIAGIDLTDVPQTGFEAGPLLTSFFYLLVTGWAFYIAYFMVARRQQFGAVVSGEVPQADTHVEVAEKNKLEVIAQSTAAVEEAAESHIPSNLPVQQSTVGYEDVVATDSGQITESAVVSLENQAHKMNALLSSDAIRYFVAETDQDTREQALTTVIIEAKKQYPLEDSWIVINESRMKELFAQSGVSKSEQSEHSPFTPTIIPEGSSSLAEAIVSGNIIAAYNLVGNRPMFSLADAAADLDAVYRSRIGAESEPVSDMLTKYVAGLSNEQLQKMSAALTTALDGTYTSEEEAVKMAIMKAVKVAA